MLKDTEHAPLNSLSTTQMTFGFPFISFCFFVDEAYAKSLFVLDANQDRLGILQQVGDITVSLSLLFFLKDLFGVWTSAIFLVFIYN